MLNWFGSRENITSTIVFDERFCHSAGANSGSHTYEIAKGTTEIIFRFEKFEEFINLYLLGNPYLPEDLKRSVRDREASFCAQLVQGGQYLCTEGVNTDGQISFRRESLTPLNHWKKLRTFREGAIAFGILPRNNPAMFHVLWATMYAST